MSEPADSKGSKREVSTIGFPYNDMDDGIGVARVMLDRGGVAMDRDQLAAALGQVPTSGAFNAKVSTARTFGLIESTQGRYSLTPLGFNILDPAREKAARAEAFLNVPLYRRTYEEFKGRQLPPRPIGLEQAFATFGVSPKQTDKARQAFDRSARVAGFFPSPAEDRLVAPVIGPQGGASFGDGGPPVDGGASGGEGTAAMSSPQSQSPTKGRALNPFIEGLLDEIPEKGAPWSIDDQAAWLQAAAHIFRILYKGTGEIVVTVKKDGASS